VDQFTTNNITGLRTDIYNALQDVAKKHNINISAGGIRYSPTECSIKITCVCVKGKDGEVLEPFEKAYADQKRFSPKMKELGDKFISNGKQFTICGWKPKNTKYPLLAKNANGVMYKFPERLAYYV